MYVCFSLYILYTCGLLILLEVHRAMEAHPIKNASERTRNTAFWISQGLECPNGAMSASGKSTMKLKILHTAALETCPKRSFVLDIRSIVDNLYGSVRKSMKILLLLNCDVEP